METALTVIGILVMVVVLSKCVDVVEEYKEVEENERSK